MNIQPGNPNFTARLTTGNPLAKTIRVVDAIDPVSKGPVKWTVRNSQLTPWLKVSPNSDFGDGVFSVSVNIYDTSVVIGTQTGTLLIESLNPTITVIVTLIVTAN